MRLRDPKTLCLVLAMCIIAVASTAFAGNNPTAKAAVHVRAHSAKAGCNPGFDITTATCEDIVTTEASFSVDAFPVFFNLTEYLGCEYGMTWPAWTYGAAFTSCSDFVIGSIINPGDGASHTWTSCQSGVCVPSFIWLYADYAGLICMAPHPISGRIDVLDCAEGTDRAIATYCAGVYGATGDDPCVAGPLCDVTPTTLDFGTVTIGEYADLSFTITNTGGGTLEGTPSEACGDFEIISGGDPYALGAGEFVDVTVRFSPTVAGPANCTIETGTECTSVSCTGTGETAPVCDVTPTALDFGTVTIGQFSGRTFTITNTGGGTLTGDVTEACGDYSITSNGGAFSLTAGQSRVVGVRFTPTAPGVSTCTVETGQAICADVSCTGVGESAPECSIDPATLDFGTVTLGEYADLSFTVTNIGGGTLEGDPSEACADFEIVGGGDPYALTAGQSVEVTIRFTPSSSGLKECVIDAGTSCDGVPCSGTGEPAPECFVDPTALGFGTVTVGEFFDLSFTIQNIGGGTLTGDPTEVCPDYEIVSGGDPYELGAGESIEVTVRFAPGSSGLKECTVDAGTACDGVLCSGTGELPPECDVTPLTLDFGTLTVGDFADLSFTIENIGEGTLTGEVSEACDYYQVTAGDGAYSLGPAETREVTVRYAPMLAGTFDCTVQTGTFCANVSCTGEAEALPVYVDIRPGACPNKLRVDTPFAIPIAVLGTAGFSVVDIDPASVRLTREGVAAQVTPLNWTLADVGTPFMGELCSCHSLGMDGFLDLRFRFQIDDVAAALNLGPLAGSEVPLTITGNLLTGEEFKGADCALVIDGLFLEDEYLGDVGIVAHTGMLADRHKIRFSYYTKKNDHIVLQVFDVQGRIVGVLVDEVKEPGIYEIEWDGRTLSGAPVPAGVYFARIHNGETGSTMKVTVLK